MSRPLPFVLSIGASLGAAVYLQAQVPGAPTVLAAPSPPGQPAVTAFVNVAVVPMDRERVLRNQTVLVQGDRIIAMGPAKRVAVPTGAVRIDGRGKFLIPGLADMHVHLRDGGAVDEASLLLFVANGITTVRDMHSGARAGRDIGGSGGDQPWLFTLRRRVAAGDLVGPRIYTAGDPDRSSPAAAAQSVAELKADGHDFVKVSGITGATYDSVVAAAHRIGLRIVGHVPPDRSLAAVLDDRWASIEHLTGYHLPLLGVDIGSGTGIASVQAFVTLIDTAGWMRPSWRPDPARLRALAMATRQAGVWHCPTLKHWLYSTHPADSATHARLRPTAPWRAPSPDSSLPPQYVAWRKAVARHQAIDYPVVKALADAGVGLLAGTDVGDANNTEVPPGFGLVTELKELVRAGLTPYQALVAATRNAAAFLGTADSTGTVAIGRRADLVLLNQNPLVDVGNAAGPVGVMVGGRWLSREVIDAKLDSLGTWGRGDPFDLQGVRRVLWPAPATTP